MILLFKISRLKECYDTLQKGQKCIVVIDVDLRDYVKLLPKRICYE